MEEIDELTLRNSDAGDISAAILSPTSFRKSRRKNSRNVKHSRAKSHRRSKSRKTHVKRKGKIKYTKNGQPYIILSSGKAKFIKGRRHKR